MKSKMYTLCLCDTGNEAYDQRFILSHPTKNAETLEEDYGRAKEFVVKSFQNEWNASDILTRLREAGWESVRYEEVYVEF